MQSLVDGMSFVMSFSKNPSFTYREGEGKRMVESMGRFGCFQLDDDSPKNGNSPKEDNEIFHIASDELDPDCQMSDTSSIAGKSQKARLLVSIGSGVSMIKINQNGSYERVNGTMIGGGTLVGLSHLLTGVRDFDEIIDMGQKGNHAGVDYLVKDIYGDKNPFKDHLQGEWLASSFARAANDHETSPEDLKDKYKKEDIISSLMFMVSYNIGQLAFFTAQQYDIDDIFFVGNYVRNNNAGMERITFGVDLNSRLKKRALFMTFDGFLGALGAFLQEFRNE
jgi:pantothenate kinase